MPVEPKRTRPDKHGEPKHRAPSSGRLELAIHGATTYVVIVDGRSRGSRTELTLASGSHEIEVQAAGESTQRFSELIEAGKTEQRDVTWKRRAAPIPVDTGDGRELMAPGEAVPKVRR